MVISKEEALPDGNTGDDCRSVWGHDDRMFIQLDRVDLVKKLLNTISVLLQQNA